LDSTLDISKVPVKWLPPSLTSFSASYSFELDDFPLLPLSLENLCRSSVELPSEAVQEVISSHSQKVTQQGNFTCPHSIVPLLSSLSKRHTKGLSCDWILDDAILSALPSSCTSLALVGSTHLSFHALQRFCSYSSLARLSLATITAWECVLPCISEFRSLIHLSTGPCLTLRHYGLDLLPASLTSLRILFCEEYKTKSLVIAPTCLQQLPTGLRDLRLSHPCSITNSDLKHLPSGLTYLYVNSSHIGDLLSASFPAQLKKLVVRSSNLKRSCKRRNG
jgi:hypothetical protein